MVREPYPLSNTLAQLLGRGRVKYKSFLKFRRGEECFRGSSFPESALRKREGLVNMYRREKADPQKVWEAGGKKPERLISEGCKKE